MEKDRRHPEALGWYTDENIKRLFATLTTYFEKPAYRELPENERNLLEHEMKQQNFPAAQDLIKRAFYEFKDWTREEDYLDRLPILDRAMEEVARLPQREQKLAKRNLLYFRAKALELYATYSLTDISSRDEELVRESYFLQAAQTYMDADLLYGVMTDYAGRVGESLAGAGHSEFYPPLMQKLFGSEVIFVNDNDPGQAADAAIVEQYIKSAYASIRDGSGTVHFVAYEDTPDADARYN